MLQFTKFVKRNIINMYNVVLCNNVINIIFNLNARGILYEKI